MREGLGKINSETENTVQINCHKIKVTINKIQGELFSSCLEVIKIIPWVVQRGRMDRFGDELQEAFAGAPFSAPM